jgi:hypothetical protein
LCKPDVLELPGPPGLRRDEVLIEVRVCGVGNWDEFATADWDLGARPPMALGVGFADNPGNRVVQLTPPRPACSIIFGTGVSYGGADISEVFHDASGLLHHAGTTARVAGQAPYHKSYGSFVSFEYPDGTGWLVQEITTRLPGR